MLLFVPYCVAHEKSLDFLTPTGGGNIQNLDMSDEARRAMLIMQITYILYLSTNNIIVKIITANTFLKILLYILYPY